MKKIILNIKELVGRLISFLGLIFIYVLGIGLTNLVARVVGKSFLGTPQSRSQWKTVDYSTATNHHLY